MKHPKKNKKPIHVHKDITNPAPKPKVDILQPGDLGGCPCIGYCKCIVVGRGGV